MGAPFVIRWPRGDRRCVQFACIGRVSRAQSTQARDLTWCLQGCRYGKQFTLQIRCSLMSRDWPPCCDTGAQQNGSTAYLDPYPLSLGVAYDSAALC